jgi:hypothetical protein
VGGGGQKAIPRPSADYFVVGRRQKPTPHTDYTVDNILFFALFSGHENLPTYKSSANGPFQRRLIGNTLIRSIILDYHKRLCCIPKILPLPKCRHLEGISSVTTTTGQSYQMQKNISCSLCLIRLKLKS